MFYMYIRSDGTNVKNYGEDIEINNKIKCECCSRLVEESKIKEVADLLMCENCEEEYDSCKVCNKEYHYESGLFDNNGDSLCICSEECYSQTEKVAV